MLLGKNPSLATGSGNNFLEVNPKGGRSILNLTQESDPFDLPQLFEVNSEGGKQLFPIPGYCIKSKTDKDEKVFINMCHCEDVPKPDERLMSPKDVGEDESIRFPLGLGLPHKEKDKSDKDCICIDVLINSEFLQTLLNDEDKRSLVTSICIQGIADKYGIFVRDDCCLKLTKTYHGSVQKFFVKKTDPYGLDNPLSVRQGNPGASTSLIQLMEPSSVEEKIASDYSTFQSVRPKNSKSKNNRPVLSEEEEEDESKRIAAMNKLYFSLTTHPSILKLPRVIVKCGLFLTRANHGSPRRYVVQVGMHYSLPASLTQMKVLVSSDRVVISERMYNFHKNIKLSNPVSPARSQANFYDGTLIVVMPLAQCNQ